MENNIKTYAFWSCSFKSKDSEEIVLHFLFLCVPIFFNLLPLLKMNLWQKQWIVGYFTLRRKVRWLLWKVFSRISKIIPKTMYQSILGSMEQNGSRLVVPDKVIMLEVMVWI